MHSVSVGETPVLHSIKHWICLGRFTTLWVKKKLKSFFFAFSVFLAVTTIRELELKFSIDVLKLVQTPDMCVRLHSPCMRYSILCSSGV